MPCHFSTRWNKNPYVYGAYSYISSECDSNDTITDQILSRAITYEEFYSSDKEKNDSFGRQNIRIPSNINDNFVESPPSVLGKHPVLLFAGEACHEKFFSTAHGAFLSGMEQAKKIVEFFIK